VNAEHRKVWRIDPTTDSVTGPHGSDAHIFLLRAIAGGRVDVVTMNGAATFVVASSDHEEPKCDHVSLSNRCELCNIYR
jgi:hypothetical protein